MDQRGPFIEEGGKATVTRGDKGNVGQSQGGDFAREWVGIVRGQSREGNRDR
jgi:hypothetical protein